MSEMVWLTIEVSDGNCPASEWQRIYSLDIARALAECRASSWAWEARSWGTVLEIAFGAEVAPAGPADCPGLARTLEEAPRPGDGVRWYFGRGEGEVPAVPHS